METKLLDSELHVMEILWQQGDTPAREIAQILNQKTGWSKTTTYTILKRCVDKGIISRSAKDFICTARITRAEARNFETSELIERMYAGATDQLVASLIDQKKLSQDEIDNLKQLISDLE